MKVFYRISNNSYKKNRLEIASKEYCLNNFIDNVTLHSDTVYIIADSINSETRGFIKKYCKSNIHLIEVNSGSNAASFRTVLNLIYQVQEDEVVLLQEDDYLYKTNFRDSSEFKFNHLLIHEGLERSDYVTLYDHPDKYIPPRDGGNPLISDLGVELTGIFLTPNSHWKYTNSTTLTFATKASTILRDMHIWLSYCSGTHPDDFNAFRHLLKLGRKVASPIPGVATHCEQEWLSPLTDWNCI